MGKRVTITQHDEELIKWLVNYYKINSSGVKFPAFQNINELLDKISLPKPKSTEKTK